MDYNEIQNTFWKNGYVIIEKFFDDTLMDKYNTKILNHYDQSSKSELTDEFVTKSSVEVIPWFPYRDGEGGFDDIDKNDEFNRITDAILNDGWENLYCMMMYSKTGSNGQAWHQDCPSDNAAKFNLNRLVYTHDITDKTGGEIVIMPNSHLAGVIPVGLPHEDLPEQLTFQPKKGTVIFLHGHCYHKVKPVRADRISTNFRAIPKGTPQDITDICVYRNMMYKFSTAEVLEERIL